jgi:hypothetical protein
MDVHISLQSDTMEPAFKAAKDRGLGKLIVTLSELTIKATS